MERKKAAETLSRLAPTHAAFVPHEVISLVQN
jgi:hypothetical protein